MKRKTRKPVDVYLEQARQFFATLAAELGCDEATAKAKWNDFSHDMLSIERMDVISDGQRAAIDIANAMRA